MNRFRFITARRALVPAAAAALLLAACNPGAFSDLEDQTWVETVSRPDDLHATGFGAGVVFAGSGGSGAGAAVAAVSQSPPGVVLLQYKSGGGLNKQIALLQDSGLNGAASLEAHPALASDPDAFTEARGNVAIGATTGSRSYAALLSGSSFEFAGPINLAAGGAPLALSFGKTDADADPGLGNTDLVALTGDQIVLVQDYLVGAGTVSSCPFSGGKNAVIADVNATDDGAEIVVATGDALVVVKGSEVVAGTCPTVGVSVSAAGFGGAMVAGDFGVAVGAPDANQVLVFHPADPQNPDVIDGPTGSVSFGETLAAGDLDGDGMDELVVGDSLNSVQAEEAGTVYLLPDADPGNPVALFDAEPQKGQHFGRALAISRFDGAADILTVGADEEVFTYFQVPLAGSVDVRN